MQQLYRYLSDVLCYLFVARCLFVVVSRYAYHCINVRPEYMIWSRHFALTRSKVTDQGQGFDAQPQRPKGSGFPLVPLRDP